MDNYIWQAILLGVLQGVTEFLPISSSGHLAIVQELLPGFKQPGILLDVLLHFGTLAAVALYFYQDLKILVLYLAPAGVGPRGTTSGWRLLIGLAVASIPTGLIGLTLQSRVEQMFQSLPAVGWALLGTAVLLVLGDLAVRFRGERMKAEDPGLGQSLIIGIFQGLAVMPGLSRSGATISSALMAGVEGRTAARFSFLLSIPAVAGATAVSLLKHRAEIEAAGAAEILGLILGPVTAAAVGYAGIGLMMRVMKKARLSYFAVYCGLLGLFLLLTESAPLYLWAGSGW